MNDFYFKKSVPKWINDAHIKRMFSCNICNSKEVKYLAHKMYVLPSGYVDRRHTITVCGEECFEFWKLKHV